MIRGQWKKFAQMMVHIHDTWHRCVGGGDGKINYRLWSSGNYKTSTWSLISLSWLNWLWIISASIPTTSFIKGHAMPPLPAAHSAGGQPQASMTQACQRVAIETDSRLRWVDFVKMKNQRFPHLRLNILRIFINPFFGNRFIAIYIDQR